jgi:hypothetical protein
MVDVDVDVAMEGRIRQGGEAKSKHQGLKDK